MERISWTQLALLHEIDKQFHDHMQGPGLKDLYMAAHRHPQTAEFTRYFSFFQSMPFASNPGARFYSYLDEDNRSEFSKPWLGIKEDGEAAPRGPVAAGEEGISPRLEDAAREGFPAALRPYLGRGIWWLRTTDRKMAFYFEGISTRVHSTLTSEGLYLGNLYNPTEEEFQQVLALINDYHDGFVLTHLWTACPPAAEGPRPRFRPNLIDLPDLPGFQDAWL